MQERQGRYLGAHQDLGVHAHGKGVRRKRLWQDGLSEPIVEFVGYDAYDQYAVFVSGSKKKKWRLLLDLGQAKGVTDRVAMGKVALCQCLIDYDDRSATLILGLIPNTSL